MSVDYQNGEVVGGVVQADIQEGSQVLLVVRADVSDECTSTDTTCPRT